MKKRLVDFETVEQRYMLWKKVTSKSFLPLLPCRQIIPILCSYWNSIKYVGDQITQMIWEIKFRPPRLTPQLVAAIKISFFLPVIQIYRLLQLISANKNLDYKSLKKFRDAARKRFTVKDTIKSVQGVLLDTVLKARSEKVSNTLESVMRRSERNVHPPKLHEEGVVEATNWLAPSIGSTPKRYKRSFF